MTTLATLNSYVDRILQDKDTKLDTDKIDDFLQQDALKLYSRHKPYKRTADLTASSSYDYTINDTNFSGWVDGFSEIKKVEYPAEYQVPNIIPREDWMVYENSTTKYLRFLRITPNSGTIRCLYITPHSVPDSSAVSIYANDEMAFCWLAASCASQAIANWYGQAKDSTLGADAIAYRDKSDIWAARGKDWLKKYIDFMFPKEIGSAIAMKEFDTTYAALGYTRLTHPEWSR